MKTFNIVNKAMRDKSTKVRCSCGEVLFTLQPNQVFTKSKKTTSCRACGKKVKAIVQNE